MANDHDFFAVKSRHSAKDGRIVSKAAVTVDFTPVGESSLALIELVRTLWMAGQFRLLPRAEIGSNPLAQSIDAIMKLLNLVARVVVLSCHGLQLRDLLLNLLQFLFGLQPRIHLAAVTVPRDPSSLHHGQKKISACHYKCGIRRRGSRR